MPFVDPLTATGPAVMAHFDNPESCSGRTLPVIGEVLTARELVETFVRVSGVRAHYTSAYTREDLLKNFPAFGADEWLVRELVGMVTYAVEYGYYAPDRDLAWSRRNDPTALTWEHFLRRSGWRGEHRASVLQSAHRSYVRPKRPYATDGSWPQAGGGFA